MVVNAKKVTQEIQTFSDVMVSQSGGMISISGSGSDGSNWRKIIMPDAAVALWRCLTGARTEAEVCVKGTDKKLYLVWEDAKDGKQERWEFCDGEALAFLDADQAMALAWSLKHCVEMALTNQRSDSVHCVWVLSCRCMLTGDTAAEGSDLIGGHERVFLKEFDANESVREFIRVLVNQAYTDSHWEQDDVNVDDVIDEIMDEEQTLGDGSVIWAHDGSVQSFEVSLRKHDLD